MLIVAVVGGCRRRRVRVDPSASVIPVAAQASEPPAPSAPESDEAWEHTKTLFNVPVGDSPVRGRADAWVTIVEFSDFHCAPCGAVETTLTALRAKYGDKVRIVWKNDPPSFHPGAEAAAEAALELRAEKGDDAFWQMHDRLLGPDKGAVGAQKENALALVKIASELGAKPERVTNAIAKRAHREAIEADLELGEDLDDKGTLHFFINGRRLEGAQPQARFERMIDEEIERAQTLLAQGVSPNDLYATLIKDGRGPRPPESKELPALPPDDPSLGSAKAKVTVHIWSDYQCAQCVAVERSIEQLRKEHGDRVRFVWHDLPLARHADARLAAQAAREAYAQRGARAFWTMHDAIAHDPQQVTRAELDAFAKAQKLDMAKWSASLDGDVQPAITADVKAAAESGITETPAYLIVAGAARRGYFVRATEETEKLFRAVERALDEAGE